MSLKTMERKKISIEGLLYWPKVKLKSIEKIISEALIDSDINHDEFNLVSNKEQNCFMLKERLRAEDDQLGDIERNKLKKLGKRIGQSTKHTKLHTKLRPNCKVF